MPDLSEEQAIAVYAAAPLNDKRSAREAIDRLSLTIRGWCIAAGRWLHEHPDKAEGLKAAAGFLQAQAGDRELPNKQGGAK